MLQGVNVEQIAQLIYECFLIEVPFKRQNLNWSGGKLKITRGPLEEGTRFIALYDQTYGSLRLSGRLLEPGFAEKVFAKTVELLEVDSLFAYLTEELIKTIQALAEATQEASTEIPELLMVESASSITSSPDQRVQIIMPGSVGLDQLSDNAQIFM